MDYYSIEVLPQHRDCTLLLLILLPQFLITYYYYYYLETCNLYYYYYYYLLLLLLPHVCLTIMTTFSYTQGCGNIGPTTGHFDLFSLLSSPLLLYTVRFQFTGHSLDLSDNVLYDWLFPHHWLYIVNNDRLFQHSVLVIWVHVFHALALNVRMCLCCGHTVCFVYSKQLLFVKWVILYIIYFVGLHSMLISSFQCLCYTMKKAFNRPYAMK